jgi:ATP-binding cassette, subfamily B, bacterial
MLTLDWRLTIAVLAFLPSPPLVAVWAAAEQMSREKALLERWVDIYGRFGEVLTGIVTVRSFVMEDREKHRFMSGVRVKGLLPHERVPSLPLVRVAGRVR